jgi:glucose/arabinose dehydrogenase
VSLHRRTRLVGLLVMFTLVGCTSNQATPSQPAATDRSPSPSSGAVAGTDLRLPAVRLRPVASGLTSPIGLVPVPDGSGRLVVIEQTGLLRVLSRDGRLLPRPFLDLRSRLVELESNYDERGLLGLAFHPRYRRNGRLFVFYSARPRPDAPSFAESTSTLSEFRRSADPDAADPRTERRLLQIDKDDINHAGATIAFGPDGYMYVSVGDSGGVQDTGADHPPEGNGQDTSTLPGSILRLDVDRGRPYGIPADNPFAGTRGRDRPEIYAHGFRNPYRFSFDQRGRLFVADVGQALYEEVDLVRKGGNYGWRIREGSHCVVLAREYRTNDDCPKVARNGAPLLDPILEYTHDQVGRAVIGGFVYRGRAVPGLRGAYVFGDYSGPKGVANLLAAREPSSGSASWPWQILTVRGGIPSYLVGIGEAADGELYLLTKDVFGPTGRTGRVLRLTADG